jgi:hypothetical protein
MQEREGLKVPDYSNWEIVNDENQPATTDNNAGKYADWVADEAPSIPQQQPHESLGAAALKAPFRVAEDVYHGGMGLIKNIPEYWNAAKNEVPAGFNTLREHPVHAGKQALAGIAELGQNVFNTPHDVINYLSQRLNLVPENFNKMVQMGRMPDSSQEINSLLGAPKYPGEELIRGVPRNALNIAGVGKAASILNPMNLTNKGIAKSVLSETARQSEEHSKMYNKLWKKADKIGFNNVSFDPNLLGQNVQLIDKFYPEKSTFSLKKFLGAPTLENAQKAQSDLGSLRRAIEEKSKTTPLLESERLLHKALEDSEKHIEGNMFKDANGVVNNSLQNQYNKISKSYAENVVPYKYNKAIQEYKARKMTPKELFDALNRGEFAVKKGPKHLAFGIRNALQPLLWGGGALGGLGGLAYLYNEAMGNKRPEQ